MTDPLFLALLLFPDLSSHRDRGVRKKSGFLMTARARLEVPSPSVVSRNPSTVLDFTGMDGRTRRPRMLHRIAAPSASSSTALITVASPPPTIEAIARDIYNRSGLSVVRRSVSCSSSSLLFCCDSSRGLSGHNTQMPPFSLPFMYVCKRGNNGLEIIGSFSLPLKKTLGLFKVFPCDTRS